MNPTATLSVLISICVLLTLSSIPGTGQSAARVAKDAVTGDVVLENEMIRATFHTGRPGSSGVFPTGYTGYTVEQKMPEGWRPAARVRYFTSYSYRSGWGRDWLAYVLPKEVRIEQNDRAAGAVFTQSQPDFDGVTWSFEFRFGVRPGRPVIDVDYSASPDRESRLLLFWGPKLYAGDESFGAYKDEALFAGVEYLGPGERSSANPALAPDARMYLAPTPAKITIPLMTVVNKGQMVGLMWDPLQKWNGSDTCPSAVFASPNWLEGEQNHLMGLYIPSIPKYAAENGLRAHTPAVIEAGQKITISARIFAASGTRVTDAVDLYLGDTGGLPEPQNRPAPDSDQLAALVKRLLDLRDPKENKWPTDYNGTAKTGPWLGPALELLAAAPLLQDSALASQARETAKTVLGAYPNRPVELALRLGNVAEGLRIVRESADNLMQQQQPDGSWTYVPTDVAEGGLAGLYAPPEPGVIAPAGARAQGITAGHLAGLFESVLITSDDKALAAAVKGLSALESYWIPTVYDQAECPQSPSLHGSYLALRCYLTAYRITGESKYLDRAVYWAKTGLPFIYLWSLPRREVTSGYIHCSPKLYVRGDRLYKQTRRDPMLYGGLYGYGSSQFSHHWFGILVQWIPMVYARDLIALEEYNHSQNWGRIANGIVTSALWQMFDRPPYDGFLPDAFSLDSFMPSGPAFAPTLMLDSFLACSLGHDWRPQTAIVREGGARCHVTSSRRPGDTALSDGMLTFTLHEPEFQHCRAIVAGATATSTVKVDGKALPQSPDLESMDECWSLDQQGLVLIKARSLRQPRRIEIALSR